MALPATGPVSIPSAAYDPQLIYGNNRFSTYSLATLAAANEARLIDSQTGIQGGPG